MEPSERLKLNIRNLIYVEIKEKLYKASTEDEQQRMRKVVHQGVYDLMEVLDSIL